MDDTPLVAVIGGTGLYSMPGLSDVEEYEIDTPFGKPSSPIIVGTLEGKRIAFLARHGKGHFLLPSEINFRANIYALKLMGIERIVSVNAVGSLREDYVPGHIVVPDQVFDLTRDRKRTFFGEGIVAHISVADPFCAELSHNIVDSFRNSGAIIHQGGTFLTIEGPRFSTKAESNVYRSWGMSIIGMNTAPEAFLAREAELCYAIIAHVTDYDVWHVSDEPVTVEIILRRMAQNVEHAYQGIRNLLHLINEQRSCNCGNALANAIVTHPEVISPVSRQKLDLLIKKYL
jgi:5'-methylthioadenosine phosphorylase